MSMKDLLGGSEGVSTLMQELSPDQQNDFYTLLPLFFGIRPDHWEHGCVLTASI